MKETIDLRDTNCRMITTNKCKLSTFNNKSELKKRRKKIDKIEKMKRENNKSEFQSSNIALIRFKYEFLCVIFGIWLGTNI